MYLPLELVAGIDGPMAGFSHPEMLAGVYRLFTARARGGGERHVRPLSAAPVLRSPGRLGCRGAQGSHAATRAQSSTPQCAPRTQAHQGRPGRNRHAGQARRESRCRSGLPCRKPHSHIEGDSHDIDRSQAAQGADRHFRDPRHTLRRAGRVAPRASSRSSIARSAPACTSWSRTATPASSTG